MCLYDQCTQNAQDHYLDSNLEWVVKTKVKVMHLTSKTKCKKFSFSGPYI